MQRTLKRLVLAAFIATAPHLVVPVEAADDLLITALDPNKNVVLLVGGRETPLAPTSATGELTIALGGALASALDPSKTYVLHRRQCGNYVIVVEDSDDDTRCRKEADSTQSQPDNSCHRCAILVGRIERGVWRPNSFTRGADEPGWMIDVFGFGSGSFGQFTNVNSASGVIDGRFDNTTTITYRRPRDIRIDDRVNGAAFGGGVELARYRQWFGVRIGILHETGRDGPGEAVFGETADSFIRFQQQGRSRGRSTALVAGPTATVPGGFVVTGGFSWSWWGFDLTQTGMLQAGCPNSCTTVRSDNVSESSRGSDGGFFVGTEYYPRNSWLGMMLWYQRTTYHDVYDPSRALAWPRDWTDSNIFVGATVRTTRRH
jgi:hypothetical protein